MSCVCCVLLRHACLRVCVSACQACVDVSEGRKKEEGEGRVIPYNYER